MSNDLISRHVFLFPFKWENAPAKGTYGPDDPPKFLDRTSLDRFHEILLAFPSEHLEQFQLGWERKVFSLTQLNHYNEFNYFYDYVREILYDLQGEESSSTSAPLHLTGKPSMLRHYHLVRQGTDQLDLTYQITVYRKHHQPDVYRLSIDAINLNVYETGVGVLSFTLSNRLPSQADPESVLRINQFGRRLAPPFFGIDADKVGNTTDFGGTARVLTRQLLETQKRELAQEISLVCNRETHREPLAEEHFLNYGSISHTRQGPFRLPQFLENLFPPQTICTQEAAWYQDEEACQKILLKPVLDDRMFLLCWYGGKELVNEAHQKQLIEKKEGTLQPNYLNPTTYSGNFWYRFLFVDGSNMSIFDMDMAKDLVVQQSYCRWAPYTYYGISRYSLVCLTDALDTLRKPWVNAAFIPQHMDTMYHRLFELCIIQRATVLRFSDEITHLAHFSQSASQGAEERYLTLGPLVSELYRQYLRFVNQIYFREVTAQEQGIEMYDMLQRTLRIGEQVTALENELSKLHQYVKLLEEEAVSQREKKRIEKEKQQAEEAEKRALRTQEKLNALGVLASAVGFPGFILAAYSLKVYEPWWEQVQQTPSTLILVLVGLFFLAFATLKTLRIPIRWKLKAEPTSDEPVRSASQIWALLTVLTAVALLAGPLVHLSATSLSSTTKSTDISPHLRPAGEATATPNQTPIPILDRDTVTKPIN